MTTHHHTLDLDDSYESNCSMNSNNINIKKGSFPYTNPYTQQQQQQAPTAKSTASDLPWSKTNTTTINRKNGGNVGRSGGGTRGGGAAAAATAAGTFQYTQYSDPSPSPALLHGEDGGCHKSVSSGMNSNTTTTTTSNRHESSSNSNSNNDHTYNNQNTYSQRKMPPSSSLTATSSSTSSSVVISLDTLLDRLPTVTVALSSPPDFVLTKVFPKLQASIQVKYEENRVWKATTMAAHCNGSSNNSVHRWKISTATNLVEWIWTLLDKIQVTTTSSSLVKKNKNSNKKYGHHGGDDDTSSVRSTWSKVFISGLVLLQNIMELWMESQEDCLLYAILVHEKVVESHNSSSNNKSTTRLRRTKSIMLIEFLTTLATNNMNNNDNSHNDDNEYQQPQIISASITCLATAWRCLDRLQWHSTTMSNTANAALESCSTAGDDNNNDPSIITTWWMQPQHGTDTVEQALVMGASNKRSTSAADTRQSTSNDGSNWSTILAQWALDTWFKEDQPVAAADADLNFLHMDEQQNRQPDQQFQQEELRLAAVTILDQLIRHGQSDWLHTLPDDVYYNLSKLLITQAQRLLDLHMPYTCYTRLSLASLSLLATLERKASLDLPHDYQKLLESTALVDYVSLASFRSIHTSGGGGSGNSINANAPRWTQTDSLLLQPWTFPILRQWNHTGRLFAQRQLQQRMQQQPQNQLVADLESYTAEAWNRILSSFQQQQHSQARTIVSHVNHAPLEDSLSSFRALLWLHTETRSIARSALSSLVKQMTTDQQQNQPTSQQQHGLLSMNASPLLASLLQSIRTDNIDNNQHGSSEDNTCNLDASQLLNILVQDRRTTATHDKLSRAIWNAIDESFVQALLQTTLVHMSVGDQNRPVLLALLDTLHTILSLHPQISWNIVESFSAQHLEGLVQLVAPRNCRIDLNQQQQTGTSFADETFDMMESDESTPPANNLSRLDEKSICVEIEDETKFHGIDETVRMAAASILATFLTTTTHPSNTNSPPSSEKDRIDLLKSRMTETLTTFVADLQLSFCLPHQKSSIDLSRRRLRLLTTLAQSDCEEFVTGLIFATETRQRHSVQDILQDACSSKKQLELARIREERLGKEKEALARQLKAQSVSFQKEKTMYQRNVSHNSKQLIQVHATERAKAEKQAHETSRQLHDLERRAAQAESEALASKEAESNMKQSLESTASRLKEREEKLQVQEKMLNERQQQVERLTQELCTTKTSLSRAIQKGQEMREHIESQEETLVGMEKSQGELQESLESLFADMVGLAQLYEHQEEQLSNSHQQGLALTAQLEQKLAKEKARNDELERRQEQMEYENEVLFKKYAHVREKLDEERSRQAEEASQQRRKKRTGPVSYINQLHNNNTSVATTVSGTSSYASSKNHRPQHRHGKENSSSSSSSRRESPSNNNSHHRDRSGSRSRKHRS